MTMVTSGTCLTACRRCLSHSGSAIQWRSRIHSTAQVMSSEPAEGSAEFDDYQAELQRRKRKADSKLRHKSGYVSSVVVTIRGGKGGSGSSAFAGSRSGGLGPPSGGDGASGSSIYLTTSPHLSDLSSVGKRVIGLQGGNGSGSWKHGRRPLDMTIKVPIGTVVREIKREDDKDRWEADVKDLPKDERNKRWRERWFVKHPSGEISDPDYHHAFDILTRKGHLDTPPSSSNGQNDSFYLDITSPISKPILLTRGGKGGLGNPHFHIPAAMTPSRLASRGVQPPTYTFELELKLLADVGLVGFPNAGKSTILRGLTGRKAEVAGYSFTTLNPQIGVVRVYEDGTWASGGEGVIEESEIEREKEQKVWDTGDFIPAPRREDRRVEQNRFTISDNPGLLPQASENVGLGHTFLRHLERCLVHVYVLDLTRPDPMADLHVLREEMEAWQKGLSEREAVVVLNKGDQVDEEVGRDRVKAVQDAIKAERKGWDVVAVSAKFGLGLDKLVQTLSTQVEEKKRQVQLDSDPATRPSGFGLKKL